MNPRQEELIDQYLSGRINADDQKELEQALEQDPGLKEHFNLQKDVVSAIKQQRHMQLKSRLDALPVSSGVAAWKKAVVAGMAALIMAGGGVLYYTSIPQGDEDMAKKQKSTEREVSPATSDESQETLTKEALEESEATESMSSTSESQNENTVGASSDKNTSADTEDVSNENHVLHQPDGGPDAPDMDNSDEGISKKDDNGPQGMNVSNDDYQKKYTEPKIVKNNKPFQYVYDGENLTLYGDFDRSTPYFLIELNRNKDIYLKYKGTYYRIQKADDKTLLKDHEVTDKSILKKLDEAE